MQYFQKELPQRTLFAPDGSAVPMEILDASTGVIQTKDKKLLEFLNEIAGTMGVSKITQAQYRDLKKKTRLKNIKQRLTLEAQRRAKNLPSNKPPSNKVSGRGGCGACGGRRR